MSATAIVVAYRTAALDTSYLRPDDELVIVHNDDALDPALVTHDRTEHIHPGVNLGFGAAVNMAMRQVDTERVVLVNPDVTLDSAAWVVLADADAREIATINLLDDEGVPTSVLAPYPRPLDHTLTGLRIGRLLPRRIRFALPRRLLGGWAGEQRALADETDIRRPLRTHWVSGAVLSLPTSAFRSVGGFDPDYFLYFEDVDLCARLADAHPELVARVLPAIGRHHVGGSATDDTAGQVARVRAASARRYAQRFGGPAGVLCRTALRLASVVSTR